MKTTFDLVQAFLLLKEGFTRPQDIILDDYEIIHGCNLMMRYYEKLKYPSTGESYRKYHETEHCLLDYMTFVFNSNQAS